MACRVRSGWRSCGKAILLDEPVFASRITAGYRALLNPSIKLGQHWFGYASVQVLGKPYFFYDTYRSPRAYSTEVLQAFGGYQFRADRATVVIKAGQLTSAFGSFPLH